MITLRYIQANTQANALYFTNTATHVSITFQYWGSYPFLPCFFSWEKTKCEPPPTLFGPRSYFRNPEFAYNAMKVDVDIADIAGNMRQCFSVWQRDVCLFTLNDVGLFVHPAVTEVISLLFIASSKLQ
jgi:hypothetical protein